MNQYISRYAKHETHFERTDTLQGSWPDDEGSILIYLAAIVIAMLVIGGICLVATL